MKRPRPSDHCDRTGPMKNDRHLRIKRGEVIQSIRDRERPIDMLGIILIDKNDLGRNMRYRGSSL